MKVGVCWRFGLWGEVFGLGLWRVKGERSGVGGSGIGGEGNCGCAGVVVICRIKRCRGCRGLEGRGGWWGEECSSRSSSSRGS